MILSFSIGAVFRFQSFIFGEVQFGVSQPCQRVQGHRHLAILQQALQGGQLVLLGKGDISKGFKQFFVKGEIWKSESGGDWLVGGFNPEQY